MARKGLCKWTLGIQALREDNVFDTGLGSGSHGDGVSIASRPAVIQRISISGIGCETGVLPSRSGRCQAIDFPSEGIGEKKVMLEARRSVTHGRILHNSQVLDRVRQARNKEVREQPCGAAGAGSRGQKDKQESIHAQDYGCGKDGNQPS